MVTRDSLLQEIKNAYVIANYQVELPDFNFEEFLASRGEFWYEPYPVERVIQNYFGGGIPRGCNFDDNVLDIINAAVEYLSAPVTMIFANGEQLTVYRDKYVTLPNHNLDNTTLEGFTHNTTDVDVIDQHTGEVIPPNTLMVKYGDGFMMASNLTRQFYICADCGYLYNSLEMSYVGEYRRVCDNCYQSGEWEVCCRCGEPVDCSDTVLVNTRYGEEYWCDDCATENSWICDCCNERYADDDFDHIVVGNGDWVCENCRDEWYYECSECGEYVYQDDVYWDEDDNPYCRYCYETLGDPEDREPSVAASLCRHSEEPYEIVIDSYHTHHNNSNMMFGDDVKKQGIEIEVEGANKSNAELNLMAKKLIEMSTDDNGYSHIYCERDGSLRDGGRGGFEIITNPHTPEEFFKLPIKEMLQLLIDNGYTSHNNGRCGLHIHFSNEWFGDDYDEIDDNVAKVIHFYSENYDTMLKLSRRSRGSAESWARRFKVDDFEESKCIKGSSTGHGTAVNLGNMNTIHTVEFRLGRGTLLYSSFMAWLDMHLAIVRNVRNIAKNDTDINKWFAGISEETKEYIRNKTGIEIVDAEREVA